MLTDDIFRVHLPLGEYLKWGEQSPMIIENQNHTIQILAPMNIKLLRYFHVGQEQIYVRGQYDDVTKRLEARELVEGLSW